MASSFETVLLLDSNVLPLRPPSSFISSSLVLEKNGALLFQAYHRPGALDYQARWQVEQDRQRGYPDVYEFIERDNRQFRLAKKIVRSLVDGIY